ncbi:hypothetical protein V5799_024427 [Amblyomma americanum]|uniref:Chitin-binding type-2 domain-containing protein n=1 Tax=Amblyomma americanum TaxID=6943 RepID=A0AAQ4EC42_AMBAM
MDRLRSCGDALWSAQPEPGPTVTEAAGNATVVAEALNSSSNGGEAGFSCEGRIFGYYGDPSNCSLFHYCEPFADPENNQFVLHAAYLCPNETVFNQLSLTCAYAHEALPCRRAPEYYYINSHVVPADSGAAQETQHGSHSASCVDSPGDAQQYDSKEREKAH